MGSWVYELPEIGSVLYTQRVLGSPGGQTLQVAVRKCMAETYFDVQKTILERDQRFFDVVISEIDLGNVDTCQV